MKNLSMGFILSVILVLCMICSYGDEITTDTTEVQTAAQSETFEEKCLKLMEFGIVTGDANGKLLLEKTITRAEMTIILLRILGLEEVAKTHSSETGFADQMAIPNWARSYVAYAKTNGLMYGDEFGIFNAMGKISGEELAVIFRRALGYNKVVKWRGNIAALQSETGIAVPNRKDLLRREVFELLWDVFSKEVKSGGGSLMDIFSNDSNQQF